MQFELFAVTIVIILFLLFFFIFFDLFFSYPQVEIKRLETGPMG